MVRFSAARLLAARLQTRAPAKTADVLMKILTDPNLRIYNGTDAKVKGVGTEGTAGASEAKENFGEDGRFMGAEALGWMGRKANRPDVIRRSRTLRRTRTPICGTRRWRRWGGSSERRIGTARF